MEYGWGRYSEEEIFQNIQLKDNAHAQLQSLAYLTSLKRSHDFWRFAAHLLVGETPSIEGMTFFLWQAIEQHISDTIEPDALELRTLREFISTWIMKHGTLDMQSAPSYIRNKAAQVFTAVFFRDYILHWPTFFADLIESWNFGIGAVDNYLRVLNTICVELSDQELSRSQIQIARNTIMKNRMREVSVPQIVDSWYEILSTKGIGPGIINQCLDVMGLYICWIDIGLVASERFMPLFLTHCREASTRESVIGCLVFIVCKGMDPLAKVELIERLIPAFQAEGLLDPIENDQTELTLRMAKLIDAVGLNLSSSYLQLLHTATATDVENVFRAVESKVPLMLAFLSSEDDDVSATVISFARQYMNVLRSMLPLPEEQRNNVQIILLTIANKMKYDTSYCFDREGLDEADFLAYRQQLKNLFEYLALLDLDFAMEFTHRIVSSALPNWTSVSFEEVEVAISLFYYIGEVSRTNHFSADTSNISRIQQMMRILVTSGVSGHTKPVVILQYLETVVRYEKFFLAEPDHIPSLLLTFLDHRGMRHANCKVRSRCAFLFTKFIKGLRNHIESFTTQLLYPLQDLLTLSTPLNGSPGQQWVSQDDQLYLYEAAGILIATSSFPAPQKAATFRELLHPVVDKFNEMLAQLQAETNDDLCEKLARDMCHAMSVTSRASKAFTNQSAMRACNCGPIFVHCLQTFLPCLQVNHEVAALQAGMRQFLHRMVVCLEGLLIPFIPQASEGLLRHSNMHSIQEYLPLIIQIISKFKKHVISYMLQVFMPIINTVFAALAVPNDDDEQAKQEKQLLRRNYFLFIASVVNDIEDVLKAQKVEAVEQVLLSVVGGAVDFPDPVSQKTCFLIFRKLVSNWGGKNAPDGFIEFAIKNIVPACFLAPMKHTFDLHDSQTLAALAEISGCMSMIYEKQGDDFIKYLKEQYMPTLHIDPEQMEKYCNALKTGQKNFKAHNKIFFQRARS